MISSLKELFPHIDEKECLQFITKPSFEILDHEEDKKCYILEENGQFKVINMNEHEIGFIAVDECLFSSSDGSRADCIVFDDDIVCFIELKHCKNKKQLITKHKKKAKKQLIATIEFFRSNINMERSLEAYICITCTIDERITMTPKASNEEAQLEFEEYYDTQLFYSCQKEFK